MARKSLPKADNEMIARHEAGKHDVYNGGYPTDGPQPDKCRECAKRAKAEAAAALAAVEDGVADPEDVAPIVRKVRKSKAAVVVDPVTETITVTPGPLGIPAGDLHSVDLPVEPVVTEMTPSLPDDDDGFDPKPVKPKRQRAKGNVLPPAPIPDGPDLIVEVKGVKMIADIKTEADRDPLADLPPQTMGFPTDLKTAEAPRTREEWMLNAVAVMREWFPADVTVPDVRVSIGWPAGRGSSRFIGQCFYSVEDKVPAVFVAPSLSKVPDILDTLLHELVHAACPVGTGHKGLFIKLAKGLGFEGPWRSTPSTLALKNTLAALATNLGEFPHSKVNKSDATRPSVQTTRMLKVECLTCGCIIRMTNKWIEEAGLPTCGCGEEMGLAA